MFPKTFAIIPQQLFLSSIYFIVKTDLAKYTEAMEVKGKTAVITGASGQLGAAVAISLAQAGCNCICHYNSNKESAQKAVEQIEASGSKALAVCADLSDPEQIEKLFIEASKIGMPQILINSAAVFSRQRLEDITFAQAQKIFNVNLIAPILTSRVFAGIINDKFGECESVVGKIVNISDVGGIRPWAQYVLYCSSKAGLIGATKSLAKELAPAICVNSIAPGLVTWPKGFDDAKKERQLSFVPVKRVAMLSEITSAIIFMLENDYITGQVLNIDGGRCI